MSVVEYYSKLVGLWNELDAITTHHRCTCCNCKCEIGKKLVRDVEEQKTHQFLMGLNDEKIAIIQRHILAMKPLLEMDYIFDLVRQEESHRLIVKGREDKSQAAAFALYTKPTGRGGDKVTCNHYGKLGHEEASCFEIIGYPASWGTRGRDHGG